MLNSFDNKMFLTLRNIAQFKAKDSILRKIYLVCYQFVHVTIHFNGPFICRLLNSYAEKLGFFSLKLCINNKPLRVWRWNSFKNSCEPYGLVIKITIIVRFVLCVIKAVWRKYKPVKWVMQGNSDVLLPFEEGFTHSSPVSFSVEDSYLGYMDCSEFST